MTMALLYYGSYQTCSATYMYSHSGPAIKLHDSCFCESFSDTLVVNVAPQ